jgi:hypothetical protein
LYLVLDKNDNRRTPCLAPTYFLLQLAIKRAVPSPVTMTQFYGFWYGQMLVMFLSFDEFDFCALVLCCV